MDPAVIGAIIGAIVVIIGSIITIVYSKKKREKEKRSS